MCACAKCICPTRRRWWRSLRRPDVSAHLDPPPATVADFSSWIALSQARRADDRAACYTLLTGNQEVSGLFMALRLDGDSRAEIGFAMAPALWGTGVFQKAVTSTWISCSTSGA